MIVFVLLVPSFLLLLLVLGHLLSKSSGASKKLPLSPPSRIPLLGHLHLLGRLPHRSLAELYRLHGQDGLLSLCLGTKKTLVVSTASAAAELIKSHDLAFASRPASAAATRLSYNSRNITFAPYGDSWRHAKKLATVHLLNSKRVAAFRSVHAEEAAELVRKVAEAGAEVELSELLYGYTNGVVTKAVARGAEDTGMRFLELLGEEIVLHTGFQMVDLLPELLQTVVGKLSGLERKMERIAVSWDKFLSQIVAEHVETLVKSNEGAEDDEEDFVDVLLRLRREGSAGYEIGEDDIKAIVKDVMAAATHTSFMTLEWAMAELMRNPRVMTKLQEEIRGAVGSKAVVGEEELHQMAYMKLVIKEALRLHPAAPLLVPRESTAAATVQGYEIPAGTRVFINVWMIGRDPASWDAPEEFRPERFVGSSIDFRGNDFQFIPFGAGRRMCPGINFAFAVMEIALASLLFHFDWRLPDGMTAEDVDMTEAPGLSTPLKTPLRLIANKTAAERIHIL